MYIFSLSISYFIPIIKRIEKGLKFMIFHSVHKNKTNTFRLFLVILVFCLTISLVVIPSYSLSNSNTSDNNENDTLSTSTAESNLQIDQLKTLEADLLLQLHTQQMGIDASKVEIKQIEEDIVIKQGQVLQLEIQIEESNTTLQASKEALANVLITYQKTGVGSQLELLLSSESLSDFLQRLSIFKEMNLQASIMLEELKTNRETLEAKKIKQNLLLTKLDEQKKAKTSALSEMQSKEKDLSEQLSALANDRHKYEEALAIMQMQWDEAILIFPKMTKVFTQIISSGNFTENSLEMDISLFGVSATLHEKTFQDILNAEKKWPKSNFRFKKDEILLDLPEYDLSLSGTFIIVDGAKLVYEVASGTQGGTQLEKIQIEQLSKSGPLSFNITPLLQGGTISKIKVQDGIVVLNIAISFFN